MQKSKVAIIRCETYEYTELLAAVQKGIDLIGGPESICHAGETIVLKPNVVNGAQSSGCVNTHTMVFKAVAKVLQSSGATLKYGDSSAIFSCDFHMKKSGIKEAAGSLGMTMADFDKGRHESHASGRQNKQVFIANGVLDADGVVSIPKLKTHGLTLMTAAVKNQFGCVPGSVKGQYHAQVPDVYDFCKMLVDICSFVKPRLYVCDAIVAMEGNGPQSGDPRQMNALLFSTDPVALDAIACAMMDLDPMLVPTCTLGAEAGLGTFLSNEIELLGDPLESFICKEYKIKRSALHRFEGNRLSRWIKNNFSTRPVILKSACTKCGNCVRVCPVDPKAVNWAGKNKKRPPRYTYHRCIRCYCCHEFCPSRAIRIVTPILARLFPIFAFIGLLVMASFYRKKRDAS